MTWTAPAQVRRPGGTTAPLGRAAVGGTFTDGRIAMVAYHRAAALGSPAGYEAFGLDLRTGEVLWSGDLGRHLPVAVAGHLVTVGEGTRVGLRGLG